MATIRLQVALANSGVASRRKAAEIIESGHVAVNGVVVTERGYRVKVPEDIIHFDGKAIFSGGKKVYYMLNKPPRVLSTARDERGRKTVLDFVENKNARLYPVGRLDWGTKGLVILTNDGSLTYRLTHPKFGIDRVYKVKIRGALEHDKAERLKKGVMVEGQTARAEKIVFLKKGEGFTILSLTLREGRKREVRRMFEVIGHRVSELKRTSYGPLKLGDLKEGKARMLSGDEIRKLKNCVGL